jgi:Tol biopolymer transport system component
VLASCGGGGGESIPSTYAVSVKVTSEIRAGEVFKFSLGAQSSTVTQGGVAVPFGTALAGGAAYTVSQTDGPRSCTASANRSGTVAAGPIEVTMDCGAPAANVSVSGQFHAPLGTQVVLQLNGGDDLSLTMPAAAGSADAYNLLPFSFATQQASGAAYQVTVKTAPSGLACSVFKGATGTFPATAANLRVGCEYRMDHVSRNADGTVRGTYFESSAPVIGGAASAVGRTVDGYGEGRFLAFVSSAVGLGGSTGAHRQVYWRDRLTGETLLISASAAALEGNGDSFAPAISADGLTVAFESYASNLVTGDSNGVRDVFVWSSSNRTVGAQRVSVSPGGAEGNAESFEPTLSGDGRVVAFSSGASNLTAGVSGISTINVYRRDIGAGTTTLVSAAAGVGVGGSRPMLSEDGNRLAFCSFASNLVVGDTNGLWDIFVHDVAAGTLSRVSLTSTGGERNQGTESASRVVSPTISGNGRYVAYATTATNVVAGDTNNAQDVFVVDTQSGSVVRASVGVAGAQGDADSPVGQGERVALSYDGNWVAFSTLASNLGTGANNVVLRNWVSGQTQTLPSQTGSSVGVPSLSRTAAYVAFGAGSALDPRFAGSGLFASFTGLSRAWWWFD